MTIRTESVKYLKWAHRLYLDIYNELSKVEEFKQYDIYLSVDGYDLMIESDQLSFDYRVSWTSSVFNPKTVFYDTCIHILPIADGAESDMAHPFHDVSSVVECIKRLEFQFEEWGFLYVTGVF